jgi:hypothetical protein
MSPNVIAPLVVAPLIVWRLYYRVRGSIGRQPIRPKRMWTRVAILLVVSALVAIGGFVNPQLAAGQGLGMLAGMVLGLVALKLTRFEIDGNNDCYYPNLWIGMGLAVLFIGRLLYRIMLIWPVLSQQPGGSDYAQLQSSPLTLAILGLLLGYYIAYYAGLLIHHRRVTETNARSQLK